MVSIHRILIVLYMTIRVLCFVFRFKRDRYKISETSIILIHQIITILAKRMRVMIVIFYSKNNQLITKQ